MSRRDDEDKTTKARAMPLRSESAGEAPQRPTVPLTGRGSKRSAQLDDFGGEPDDAPTMYDPNVPTGARGMTEDERADAYPDIDENELPSGATVVGKRSAVTGAPKLVGPRPDEPAVPSRANPPPKYEPLRIDESARTHRWDPPEVVADAEPTGPALRPPPKPTHAAAASPVQGLPLAAPASAPIVRPDSAPLAPPLGAPPLTPRPPILPLQPAPNSEPIRVMSMKAPPAAEAEKQAPRQVPEVRMRGIAEVRNQRQTPPQGMGFLAPPRDPKEARSRRRADYIIWGSVVVIVAAVVMLAVWFLAR